ncbi:hypothetical protein GCM10010525_16730 [Glutamicibacter bergerei]|uniref:Transposase n=1 Tax=Glutamicibacter ardleyensis TaxID=225894 RepID=A0ABQ2D7U6_9MICC|nr:hypothetical protein GCM10007173_01910 [Glutamicibacter ardleyensis]
MPSSMYATNIGQAKVSVHWFMLFIRFKSRSPKYLADYAATLLHQWGAPGEEPVRGEHPRTS